MKKSLTQAAILAVSTFTVLAVAGPAHADPVNGQSYRIKNVDSGKCMDIRDATWNLGGQVQQFTCHAEWNQHFVFRKAEVINGRQTWRLTPRYTDGQRCVDVRDGTSNGGELLQTWTCHSGWQQRFHIVGAGGGRYTIRPSYNGWCLTVSYPRYDDLAPIRQYPCGGSNDQLFYIQRA
ncbi:hypothetical protein GCM10010156_05460 [Planobispora rosea]|uniref:Ricin B lectin domain-containing protein n=1 Tax=Planobispora rosea TaxID=35762 RepID=A0A8J3RVH4_PLARO|nr:RICIN domain-containing protein [Planobispora rosea]GGS49677.1 hypothetical protein GCM10010156_05460 [Planobispora rosea]GIH83831.1 hypothetical protein Pro02_22390 [Planobispora rosea]